jgi:transcriptional regulator with XRE-family HTH domain
VLAISNTWKKLLEKLGKPAYRRAYLAEHVRRGVAYQIRALRDQRHWNQGEFSDLLGKPQSVVSRLEDPSYGKVTLQTLLEVASAFDVALQVRFVSYSSFIQQTRNVSGAAMEVPSFKDDLALRPANVPGLIFGIKSVSGQGNTRPIVAKSPAASESSSSNVRTSFFPPPNMINARPIYVQ